MIYIIKMITDYVIFLYKVKVSLYIETSKLKGNFWQCKKKTYKSMYKVNGQVSVPTQFKLFAPDYK